MSEMTLNVDLGNANQVNAGIMATVTLYLWNAQKDAVLFEVNDIMIRRKRDGGLFVSMPQKQFEVNGEKRYKKLVKVAPQEEISNQTGYRARFEAVVMQHYNEALQGSGGPTQQAPQQQAPQQYRQTAPLPPQGAPTSAPAQAGPPPPTGDTPSW